MRSYEHRCERMLSPGHCRACLATALVAAVFLGSNPSLVAQQSAPESLTEQIQKLTDAMARAQAQLEESQRQLNEMRAELPHCSTNWRKASPLVRLFPPPRSCQLLCRWQ